MLGSGTYSYNSTAEVAGHFKSIEAHNTVQFGQREQMPRISKFLLGKWIVADEIGDVTTVGDTLRWSGRYTDAWGNTHRRTLELGTDGSLEVIDAVQTSEPWKVRFNVGDVVPQRVDGTAWRTDSTEIVVTTGDSTMTVEQGYTSLYYQQYQQTCTMRIDGPSTGENRVTIHPLPKSLVRESNHSK